MRAETVSLTVEFKPIEGELEIVIRSADGKHSRILAVKPDENADMAEYRLGKACWQVGHDVFEERATPRS